MIARKITCGDQTDAFRQPDGKPLWLESMRTEVRQWASHLEPDPSVRRNIAIEPTRRTRWTI